MADKKRIVSEKRANERAKSDTNGLLAAYGFTSPKKDAGKKSAKKK